VILLPAPLPKGRITLANAARQRLIWRCSGKDCGKDRGCASCGGIAKLILRPEADEEATGEESDSDRGLGHAGIDRGVGGCGESSGGAGGSIARSRAGEWAGGGEADSGQWRMGAGADDGVSVGTESNWAAGGSTVCSGADPWAGDRGADSEVRREDGGVWLDTGDKGRDEGAVEGVQPFACWWAELFTTSLVGRVVIDGWADCDCADGLGASLP